MKKISRNAKVFTILIVILLVFSSTYYTFGNDNMQTNSVADSLTEIEGNDNKTNIKKLILFTLNSNLTTQENTEKTQLPLNYLSQRKININEEVFKEISFNKGDSILIEIPEVGEYEAIVDKVTVDINGVLNIRGQFKNSKYSYIIISINEDKLTASINLVEENKVYTITYKKNNNSYYLNNIDTSVLNKCEDLDEPPKSTSENSKDFSSMGSINTNNLDEEVTIDVMFVYTENAEKWANANLGGINTAISNALEESQLVLDNSDVGIKLNMVHSAQVDYVSSDSSITDLHNITFLKGTLDPMGKMDEVHKWRDKYGADLVVLIGSGNIDAAGRGWLGSPLQNGEYGYSVCNVSNLVGDYVLIHEIGHNMGCRHSRNQKEWPAPVEGGAFEYSTGWRWNGNDGKSYASVMTYREGSRSVPIFSNPNITWQGQPTGSYIGEYAPADNARSLREMKHIISNHRLEASIGNEIVKIEDTNLLTALRNKLDKPSGNITRQDLYTIESLEISSININSLSGLEFATNLRRLSLTSTGINNFTALYNLPKLTFLSLNNNQIKDISGLSNLTNLTELRLSKNSINDLEPLSKLKGLVTLELEKNQIEDINALSNLTNLEELNLNNNQISDISPFKNLKKLQKLKLNKNKIKDIGGLSNLIDLLRLELSENQISNISTLKNLKELERLKLNKNQIKDISNLCNLPNIIELDLEENEISNLSTINNLITLKDLKLRDNQIKDISKLSSLTNLHFLGLGSNEVSNVTPLRNLVELIDLYLQDNQITDINPLSNLSDLYWLDLGYNQIIDIKPLKNLKKIGFLDLGNNKIEDMNSIVELDKLWMLDLSQNEIKEINLSSKLSKLSFLYLDSNKLKDISNLVDYIKNLDASNKISIYIKDNYLNISDKNSKNMEDINQLLKYSNVTLDYDYQKEVVGKVYLNINQLFLNKDHTYKIEVTIKPEDFSNKNILWSSSNKNIVTVDENGLIKGINPGKAIITVELEDGGYYDTCEVTVIEPNYDVNDDGLVDKKDILTLSSYYRSVSSDQVYNESFDLNLDGKINILDIVLLSKQIN